MDKYFVPVPDITVLVPDITVHVPDITVPVPDIDLIQKMVVWQMASENWPSAGH